MLVPEFYFSGTVGDAFIAMCKLRTLGRPYTIRRLCRIPGSDSVIRNVAALFTECTYVEPYLHFDTIPAMRDFAYSVAGRYVNIFFDGDGRGKRARRPGRGGF